MPSAPSPEVKATFPPPSMRSSKPAKNASRSRSVMEILRLLVRGQSTKEIVGLMKLSMGTIRLHISIILEKLDAFDRTNAVAIAIERGIVRVGE